MTKKEISVFIDRNSKKDTELFFDKLLLKLDDTNRVNDKVQISMIISVSLFFAVDLEVFSMIRIGPMMIADSTFIKLFIPVLFNFLFLRLATLSVHRAHIIKNIRQIGRFLYKLDKSDEEDAVYSNSFLRVLMPYSLWEEVNSKFLVKGKFSALSIILVLPISVALISPFIFEYIILSDLFKNYWAEGWVQKIIILGTIWMFFAVLIYFVQLIRVSMAPLEKDISNQNHNN